jgi:hypothetical protein
MGSLSSTYYDATGELALGVDDVTATTNINIEITSQKVSQGRTISRSIDNRVYLRNKQ